MSGCLEQVGKHNIDGSHHKTQADQAQGWNPNGKHGLRGIEHFQKDPREDPENQSAQHHNGKGDYTGKLDRADQTTLIPCPIIIAHNRHGALIEPKHRHKYKRLEFIVNPEDGNRRSGKPDENPIETNGQDRGDRLHNNGRKPDRIDIPDGLPAETEAL